MEIFTLEQWTPEQRLEVARFVIDPRYQKSSDTLPEDQAETVAELMASGLHDMLERGIGVWQGGTLSLVAYIGKHPYRLFHFAADTRFRLSEKALILNRYLETTGETLIAVDRLALARMAAYLLGFKLRHHAMLNLGMGEREYFVLERTPSFKSSSSQVALG